MPLTTPPFFSLSLRAVLNRSFIAFGKKDTDKSGLIDYADFCEIMNVDPSAATEKLFKMFDTLKTGQIFMKEVRLYCPFFTGSALCPLPPS